MDDYLKQRTLRPAIARFRPTVLLSLSLVTLFAAGIRLPQLRESLWLDELHSAWVVAGPVNEVVPRSQIGNQSPLYFYLVQISTALMGMNEVGMRFPSLLAGTALAPLLMVIVLRWSQSLLAALVAGVLVALDHHCVFYSQEARPYALVQLVGVVHMVLFWRLQSDGWGNAFPTTSDGTPSRFLRLTYIAVGTLLFYLHYTAALLFAAEFVCGILLHLHKVTSFFGKRVVDEGLPPFRGKREPTPIAGGTSKDACSLSHDACPGGSGKSSSANRLDLRRLLLDLTIISVACLPAVPHLLDIAKRRENWSTIVSAPTVPDIVSFFSLNVYLLIPLVGLAVVMAFRRFRRRTTDGNSPPSPRTVQRSAVAPLVLVLACWFVVPVGLAWLATVTKLASLFMVRYLVVVVVVPILGCALLIATSPRGILQRLLAALVIATAVSSSGMIAQWKADGRLIGDRNQGWREAIGILRQETRSRRWPLFVRSGLLEANDLGQSNDPRLREYCLLPIRGIYPLDARHWNAHPMRNTRAGEFTPSQRRQIDSAGGAWLLLNGIERSRRGIQRRALAALAAAGAAPRVVSQDRFGEVELIGIAVDPENGTTAAIPHHSDPRPCRSEHGPCVADVVVQAAPIRDRIR